MIYVGMGMAVLLATSLHTPARAIAVVCCALVLGCVGILRTQIMPRSAWVVQVLPKPHDVSYLRGSRVLVTLWTFMLAISTLFLLAIEPHTGLHPLRSLLITMSAVLVLPQALTALTMMGVRSFPFTEEKEATPERFVFAFLRVGVLVPCAVIAFGYLASNAARSAGGVALWLAAMCSVASLARHPRWFAEAP